MHGIISRSVVDMNRPCPQQQAVRILLMIALPHARLFRQMTSLAMIYRFDIIST
jgi:hypothetical protein